MTTEKTEQLIKQVDNWVIKNQYGEESPIVMLLNIVKEQQKQIKDLQIQIDNLSADVSWETERRSKKY
jgi:hypothetical protein